MRSARPGLWLFLMWALAACSPPPLIQQQSYVFGTLVEISVYGAPEAQARQATAAVLARFDALHQQLHAWQPSELSRLNATLAISERASVTPDLAAMLRDAQTFSTQSGDLFNPAIGGLIALWGFHADTPQSRVPDAAAIADWVKRQPRMGDLHIENNRVWSDNPAVQLDLGGYAKGRALDDAVVILKQHGIKNALVNIGGNVIALGQHGDRSWRVGIQHPRKAGTLATLDLRDGEAIGTSGDYQRYFEAGGKRYSHLIDPRSGWPATGMQSVTVLVSGDRAGTRSDALSKPLFIGGAAQLSQTAARLNLGDYLAVDAGGQMQVSAAMQARLR
ncbi:MAG TPA: FAD:protein FMN transferase [Thiobacillus sp.]|nr:MAG: thiamine biosynthesis protein ApbE [Hydrogenophilales bacterium 28-61-11]OYZ57505.1 MAG: thiamine biosynthesis protein ApbE [Hydrogenophilales bacterium 16-61-112]OZA44972.1 MAG: thiamine biosynthesis protein ApbE [Hydrogenophilales bacterium 17-61-76]HQT32300.1 FAD:protein FMN transferase [Thiobacillus sp.]HQT70814.1 FAD:protein FMN transferase [Thiobacillus sp.]